WIGRNCYQVATISFLSSLMEPLFVVRNAGVSILTEFHSVRMVALKPPTFWLTLSRKQIFAPAAPA
ncbi:MAG: hypothetical protein ACK5TC_00005, partial [bacterium]